MDPAFVLVHSPSVGPLTWAPVAERLTALGRTAVVPSLVDVTSGEPPFWPAVATTVAAAIERLPVDRPVVLVAHSNAGLFIPVVVDAAPRPVAACLFVDAALPARTSSGSAGSTPVAPAELLDFLRAKVTDGRLPQWTDWWDEADVAPMFDDPATRAAVTAEQPRLPLSYYQQAVPVPAGWDGRPCGYLMFGSAYAATAQDARDRGWPVEHIPGEHLHQIIDPDAVTAQLIAMVQAALPNRAT